MNSIDILKKKRTRCEENDLCFECGKFLRAPQEVFHPLIGFITIGEGCGNKRLNILENYESKYKNNSK
jgi:hypothetical protein